MVEVARANPGNEPKQKSVAEARVDYIKSLQTVDASKQRHFEAFMASLRKKEAPIRDADNKVAENALARLDDGSSDRKIDKQEKQTLQDSIDQFLIENPDANPADLRDFTIGSVTFLQNFREKYEEWRVEYQNDQNPDKGSEHDYILAKALKFIDSNRSELLKWRVSKLNLHIDNPDSDESKQRSEILLGKVGDFFEANKSLILDKNTKQPALDDLYKQYLKIFSDNGFDKVEPDDAKALFNQLVDDLRYAELVSRDVTKSGEEMMKMVEEGVVNIEEWNARRVTALRSKKFTEQDAEKSLQIDNNPVVVNTSVEARSTQISGENLGTLRDIGWQSLEPVGGVGNQFKVIYDPQYGIDRDHSPIVEIHMPDGVSDIHYAKFTFQDRYQDAIPVGKNRENLHGQAAVEYGFDALKMAYNKALLDTVLNEDSDIKLMNRHNLILNNEITDDLMMNLARGLFGIENVNDHQLSSLQLKSFKYLMLSILKSEREGKFEVGNTNFHESIKNLADRLNSGQLQGLREFYLQNFAHVEELNGNYDKVQPFDTILKRYT